MRLDQITKVPFEATSDQFYVDGSNDKQFVKRTSETIDDVCPGGHYNDLNVDELDNDQSVLEPCKAYTMFRICRHTFSCECRDYLKGNDCKHIILGM